ncbi:hypothetical protein L1856_09200 [Streptomyces sp. Tue 6430]|nr:hypothetical protein [Streptomyces sp. Tue 6430]
MSSRSETSVSGFVVEPCPGRSYRVLISSSAKRCVGSAAMRSSSSRWSSLSRSTLHRMLSDTDR